MSGKVERRIKKYIGIWWEAGIAAEPTW